MTGTNSTPKLVLFSGSEKQLVMTSVEAEIAFGLGKLGTAAGSGRRVTGYDILNLAQLRISYANLSGGEKQKVALAAVLAIRPVF